MKDKNITEYLLNLESNLQRNNYVRNVIRLPFLSRDSIDKVTLRRKRSQIQASFKINTDAYKTTHNEDCVMSVEDKRVTKAIDWIDKWLENNSIIDDDLLQLFAECNSLLTVYLCCVINQVSDDFYNKFQNLSTEEKEKYYFRGHKSYKYALLPSFYRELSVSDSHISIKTIEAKYKQIGLIDKYRKIFDSSVCNYNMMTYFQHTLSYSPLLDLTSSLEIGKIFATLGEGINPNSYFQTDAALFVFHVKNDQKFKPMIGDYFNILFFKKKITMDTMINNYYLYEMNCRHFEVDFYIDSNQPNDRMKYQKGSMLFIYGGVIVNGQMLIPANQISISKIKILAGEKKSTYQEAIRKCPQYGDGMLMNPYSFISKYYK